MLKVYALIRWDDVAIATLRDRAAFATYCSRQCLAMTEKT
jgi:hypothetical protein